MKRISWVVVAACAVLLGCESPADEDTDEPDDGQDDVFDPLVGTIDRAEGVQDLNMDRKSQMDAAIEDSE